MIGLGRSHDFGKAAFDQQVYQNSEKTYAQEIAVDSLRHSDVSARTHQITHCVSTHEWCVRSGRSRLC